MKPWRSARCSASRRSPARRRIAVAAAVGDIDDQLTEARAVAIGATTTGETIDVATDVDMFAVAVQSGDTIEFDIDRPTGSTLDSYLRLFNAAGTQLTSNDDGRAPGESWTTDSYRSYTFAQAGTYYVGISGYGNQAYSALTGEGDGNGRTGAYNLRVGRSGDLDDQIREAIPVSTNQVISGNTINVGTDADMFSFSVAAGDAITFDIDRPSGTLDSYLRLFDANGAATQQQRRCCGARRNRQYVRRLPVAQLHRGRHVLPGRLGLQQLDLQCPHRHRRRQRPHRRLHLDHPNGTAQASVQLSSLAWAGTGQVVMQKQGADTWTNDAYTARGDRAIPTGLGRPVWIDANRDGDASDTGDLDDPVAYVRGSQPTLRATFAAADAPQIWVRATSTDDSAQFVFTGTGAFTGGNRSVDLTTTAAFGTAIRDRTMVLQWEVSTDGTGYQPAGTSSHQVFVLYDQPLNQANNSPTARRIKYAANLADNQSTIMTIAQPIADDAMGRFNAYYYYKGEAAWNVLTRSADCGSDSWLMANAMHVLGVPAEVRYVYPRTGSWTGLWRYDDDTTGQTLGYVERTWFWSTFYFYEGCTYVSDGVTQRYYMGGYDGEYKASAYDVLMYVTAPNTASGTHQAYRGSQSVAVAYPAGTPPAEVPSIPQISLLAVPRRARPASRGRPLRWPGRDGRL